MSRFRMTAMMLVGAAVWLSIHLPAASAADGRPIVIEGESLVRTARSTQGRVAGQNMSGFGRAWSGDAQLSWVPPQDGHQLYLSVPVRAAGEYEIAIYYTRANNCGDFIVFVGRKQLGGTQPGYSANVVQSGRVVLGRAVLSGGNNQFVITGAGKDARSIGWVVGLDKLELRPREAMTDRPPGSVVVRPPGAIPDPPQEPIRQQTAFERDVAVLERDLDRLRSGASWQRYLQIGELKRLAAIPSDQLDAASNEKLHTIYERAYKVNHDSKYESLVARAPFQAVYVHLQKRFPDYRPSLPGGIVYQLPAGAVLYHGGDVRSTTDVELFPDQPQFTFFWDVQKVRGAAGIVWQVSQSGFPEFSASTFDLPTLLKLDPSYVGTIAGKVGSFTVDFSKLSRKTRKTDEPDFHVRVLPLTTLVKPTLAGQPSNVIGVTYGHLQADLAAVDIFSTVRKLTAPKDKSPVIVPLHAVQVKDGDGQRPAAITADKVKKWVDRANDIYEEIGVFFRFDPDPTGPDWSVKPNTIINLIMGNQFENWETARDEANKAAATYQTQGPKAVVFFRYGFGYDKAVTMLVPCLKVGPGLGVSVGSTEVVIKKEEFRLQDPTGGGFSWSDLDFVAMPGFNVGGVCGRQNIDLLAHELGHYLGLSHTFAAAFGQPAEALQHYQDQGSSLSAFDGDGLDDTPPDPFVTAWQCDTTKTVLAIGHPHFSRENVMSYWDSTQRVFSPKQAAIVHATLAKRGFQPLPPDSGLFGEPVVVGEVRNVDNKTFFGHREITLTVTTNGVSRELCRRKVMKLEAGQSVYVKAPVPEGTNSSTAYRLTIEVGDLNPANDSHTGTFTPATVR